MSRMRMKKRKKVWTGMRWRPKLVARTEKMVSLRMTSHRDLRKNGQDANYDRHLVVSIGEGTTKRRQFTIRIFSRNLVL